MPYKTSPGIGVNEVTSSTYVIIPVLHINMSVSGIPPIEKFRRIVMNVLVHNRTRVQDTGYRTQDTRHRVQDTGYRTQGTGQRVQGTGHRIQGTGHRTHGTGYRTQGTGYRT